MGVFDAADGAYVKNELYAGYTLAGDTPVLLFEGSARSAYSLMEVGRLFYYGSGGAMYSIFGEAAVNDDNGVEWVDYYFTYETDEAMTEIGFYHNTDGKWDPAVSERLDTDEDAFFALRDVYAGRTVILEDTKFAELADEDPLLGVMWNETGYTFYIDGVEDGKITEHLTARPEFILISTEVHGYRLAEANHTFTEHAKENVGDTFVVDYIRVFDKKD